jgi:hypothetical protein
MLLLKAFLLKGACCQYQTKKSLSGDLFLKARIWVAGTCSVEHYDEWITQTKMYTDMLATGNNKCPSTFWEVATRCGAHSGLAYLGQRLGKCGASTGDLERLWSTMGYVYGSSRMRLGGEKAFKMAFLYRRLNQTEDDLLAILEDKNNVL